MIRRGFFNRCDSGAGHHHYFISFRSTTDTKTWNRSGSFVLGGSMAREFARSFYSSKAWQDCRNEYMSRRAYLCEDCLLRGKYVPAIEVHHIEELTPLNIHRPEITLNPSNLVCLCRECHKARHNGHSKGRRYVFDENGKIILTE